MIKSNGIQLNEDIRDNQVRLIGSDGVELGIYSAKDALSLANGKGLDLAKIAAMANPPVCKIMDYSKYCFEQAKREKEAAEKKIKKRFPLKEIQLTYFVFEYQRFQYETLITP